MLLIGVARRENQFEFYSILEKGRRIAHCKRLAYGHRKPYETIDELCDELRRLHAEMGNDKLVDLSELCLHLVVRNAGREGLSLNTLSPEE